MELNFDKKTVLITGATRGIGAQLAADFEALGASLILTGTEQKKVDALNKQMQKQKKDITYYAVDFSQKPSLSAFLKSLKNYKKIDVCINNAGINRINYFYETKETDLDDILNVNLRAPFLICREVSSIMKKNKYGRIVNISSIFGVISREKRSIYSTTKSGIIGMTKSMALDLAPYNVLANCVSPGFVSTDLTKSILSEKELKELEKNIPMHRLATTKDISNVVVFLASNLNTYICGQNIIVDGGYVSI
jgi:3-oxoacyl-[acyl-carrier protein] reductase